ncbi:MAG TPA: MBL fold metallo-hydrolase, partial [Balneolaceae bacterium]|nr:MBL fold metallo-hydrolase [Balneolaceae bacterium]
NLYDEKPAPDVILITHPHGDHLSPEALASLNTTNTSFYVPQAVADEMPEEYLAQTTVISNGESMEYEGITINAVPMYNLPEEGARHAKGWGNGYVLSMGGKDVYVSGDTEGIPEMRNLEGIDVAFVCMNLPYTMDINQASDAVLDFEPTIVYPYHHRGQDIEEFKKLVDAGNKDIEVRLKNWYPR